MAFKDFLKRVFKEEQEVSIKKLNLSELPAYSESELTSMEEKFKSSKNEIEEKLKLFIQAINSQMKILEKITLENKKEQEKIKQIVTENLKFYIGYLKKLTEDLEKQSGYFKDYLNTVIKILNNFESSSRNSYEKSTILIGKELGNTRQLIRDFFSYLNSIANESKQVFERQDSLNESKKLLQDLKDSKKIEAEIEITIKDFEKQLKNLELEMTEKEAEISELKKTNEYKKELEIIGKREKEINDFNREISSIKDKIDLKFIAKYFHSDIKKSNLIKKYTENFISALEQDSGLELSSLIKEAKHLEINLENIKEKANSLKKEIVSPVGSRISQLEKQSKEILTKKHHISNELEKEVSKQEKFKGKEQEIKEDIKEKAKKLSIELSIT